jgi:AcrR family transcriptional regulator
MQETKNTVRAAQAIATKEQLIGIARTQFAERGYEAVSLDDILKQSKLTKGAIYHHFGDKKGLFREVVTLVQSEVAAKARRAGKAQTEPLEALLAVCRSFFSQLSKPDVMRIVCMEAGVFLSWAECTEIDDRHMLAVMREFVLSSQESGLLVSLDAEAITRVITGSIYQTVEWASHDKTPSRINSGEKVVLSLVRAAAND